MTIREYCGKYNIILSKQQMEAMLRGKGETLLLAVPGSGKTTVIIARTGYLIHCLDIDPSKILTITYSKAAALEMKERYHRKFHDDTALPRFSTIHSLCVSINRCTERTHAVKSPRLETDNKRAIRRALYEKTKTWPSEFCVKRLTLLITAIKNRMMSDTEIEAIKCQELSSEFGRMKFSEFYVLYQDYLAKNNLMDFDDQLLMAYNYLLDYEDIRQHFQTAYPHIGVDESQDTSLVQFEIIRLLANGGESLFVVGDDDQSIYGFRGAEPANILRFTDTYPRATVMYMETNYRSSRGIVDAADTFIKWNRARYKKTAVAAKNEPGEIVTTQFETEDSLYAALLRRVKEAAHNQQTLAIISRNNYYLLPVTDCLRQAKLEVRRRDNFESFFTHPTVSGIINILTLATEPWNLTAFRYARSTMKTYISNKLMAAIEKTYEKNPLLATERDVTAIAAQVCAEEAHIMRALDAAKPVLRRIANASPSIAIDYAVQKFSKNVDSGELPSASGLNTSTLYIGVLKSLSARFKDVPPFLQTLKAYAESTADTRNADSNVTLTTIHSAKGLEFDNIILIDAIDGILPQDSFDDKNGDPEEEARLFYVAVTRARYRVDFFVPRNLFGIPVRPSPFIHRMREPQAKPEKLDEKPEGVFKAGDHVTHSTFGNGVVAAVDRSILTVRFDKSGEKRLLASFCKPL